MFVFSIHVTSVRHECYGFAGPARFLCLPAFDTFNISSINPVIDVHHHQTAFDICQIIAGDQFGYFTFLQSYIYLSSRFRQHPVQFSRDPQELAGSWKAIEEYNSANVSCSKSNISSAAQRLATKFVSEDQQGFTSAHLVPAAETAWVWI